MNIRKVIRLSLAGLLLCLAKASYAANWVKQIRSNSLDDKLQIVIDLAENPDFKVFALSNPVRLVVDVQGRPVIDFSNNLNFKNRGVSKVRTGMNENDKVRVVLDLVKDFRWKAYEMKPEGSRGHRVVVEVFDSPKLLAKASQRSTAKPSKNPAVKTGTTVTDRQLVLESTSENTASTPIETIAKTPKFTPVIKEATDVLGIAEPTTSPSVVTTAPITEQTVTEVVTTPVSQPVTETVVATITPAETIRETITETQPVVTETVTTETVVSQTEPVVAAVSPKPSGSIFDDPTFKTTNPTPTPQPAEIIDTTTVVTTTPKPKTSRHGELVIMIDPGHGGKDPGAIGKGGTREKHVVLQIAKRLKKRIDETYGMRAILTRSSDRYISLKGRLSLANKHKPDMFVSIHADAAQNRSASGSSVFILSNSGASSKTAKWIAKRENSVDDKYGSSVGDFSSDVGNFLLGMQQDITIESSHAAANKTLSRLKGIGKVHKRRVERAGFAVLKYPSIPSMLVETAFLSNPEEERKLKQVSYQEEIAEAIATGIEEYFRTQGKL